MTQVNYNQDVLLSNVDQTLWLSTDAPWVDRNTPYMSKTQKGNFQLFPGSSKETDDVHWGDLIKIANPNSEWLSSHNTINDTAEWQSSAESPWPVLDQVVNKVYGNIWACIETNGLKSLLSCIIKEIPNAIESLVSARFFTVLRMAMFQCAVLCPATDWTQGGLYDSATPANLLLLDVQRIYIDPKIDERDLAIIGYLLLYGLIVKLRSFSYDFSPLGVLQDISTDFYNAIAEDSYLLSQNEDGVGSLEWYKAAQSKSQQFMLSAAN